MILISTRIVVSYKDYEILVSTGTLSQGPNQFVFETVRYELGPQGEAKDWRLINWTRNLDEALQAHWRAVVEIVEEERSLLVG